MDVCLTNCGLLTAVAACAALATAVAAAVITVGYQAGTRAAHAWHGHRTNRDADLYLRFPQLRPVIDHFDQPRKENPQP